MLGFLQEKAETWSGNYVIQTFTKSGQVKHLAAAFSTHASHGGAALYKEISSRPAAFNLGVMIPVAYSLNRKAIKTIAKEAAAIVVTEAGNLTTTTNEWAGDVTVLHVSVKRANCGTRLCCLHPQAHHCRLHPRACHCRLHPRARLCRLHSRARLLCCLCRVCVDHGLMAAFAPTPRVVLLRARQGLRIPRNYWLIRTLLVPRGPQDETWVSRFAPPADPHTPHGTPPSHTPWDPTLTHPAGPHLHPPRGTHPHTPVGPLPHTPVGPHPHTPNRLCRLCTPQVFQVLGRAST